MQPTQLLLTYTPPARNLRARIFRHQMGKWIVLIRDIAYDGAPRSKYVSQRDFDMLIEAEAFAQRETGHPATVSLK